jgi:hypothetical protein
MRHLTIIFLLTFGLYNQGFSDAGNCAKYEVDIQLTDGQKIKGYVYVLAYELKFKFQDNSFLDYLKRNNSPDTLYLYKSIHQLKFPITKEGTEKCEFHFNATAADNEIKILKKTIKAAKLISYSVCNNCDSPDEKNGYYWNGIYPTIITELTKTEIDLLQTNPIATISFGHNIEDNTDGYWMISYSSNFKQTDLEKLKNDFLLDADKLLRENKWDIVQGKYRIFKSELRKKKIILFKIGYAL